MSEDADRRGLDVKKSTTSKEEQQTRQATTLYRVAHERLSTSRRFVEDDLREARPLPWVPR
jgi:hypothetical protein